MFGKVQLENFEGVTKLPQRAASAWSKVNELVGATYKPLLFLGTQTVKGTNYWFLAELQFAVLQSERRVVILAVNEFNGEYEVVQGSIEVVIG